MQIVPVGDKANKMSGLFLATLNLKRAVGSITRRKWSDFFLLTGLNISFKLDISWLINSVRRDHLEVKIHYINANRAE